MNFLTRLAVAGAAGAALGTLLIAPAQAAHLPSAATAAAHNAPKFADDTYYFQRGSYLEVNKAYSNSHGTLVFQSDGNLVVYNEYGRALWNAGTYHRGKTAVFQGDGNFVVYDGFGTAVWDAGTTGRGNTLVFQTDGNLVIYDLANQAAWNSRTGH
ncbi:hypothetical protein GCM10010174_29310 [Kutzneria viridogrisea]|uniref:Bulb-type lectin domain-containing protein n=2 Tax=Kutzneria TaxID=43356 RepID=W5WID6_9PSEU|nr:hypothetical protein [Kutzneria albida]AHH97924.1 hypothetical protein KALB_4562 [Kutzneria albida DSM 43870]MBA8924422.1 hypothetical protein [Kutzneria viridogrisea]